MKIFGLADCNNFYVSCERVHNPSLRNVPVIVLSNNDGCTISRSDEAKALGIEMGNPYHQLKETIRRHGIRVFSSNYALYGDMSARVMTTLGEWTPDLEVYSIDEAFMRLEHAPTRDVFSYACRIRSTVRQETGIPICIGLGQMYGISWLEDNYKLCA
jgi:DNA polymerase V